MFRNPNEQFFDDFILFMNSLKRFIVSINIFKQFMFLKIKQTFIKYPLILSTKTKNYGNAKLLTFTKHIRLFS